ncbi:protein argonaute-3 [Caerostris darwini]|uniref:Protein argonaute-3 n=1 Tax=Caerostris darwini TaxID=1538125 RepID=A0AAV4UYN5_9ARAC|nr:protein argonaute-3 [Caerostris darwini]
MELPPKRESGKLGKPILLIANCFAAELPNGEVYHYDIELDLKNASSKNRRKIIDNLLKTHVKFEDHHPAYDGMKNLYSRKPLSITRENIIYEAEQKKINITIKTVCKKDSLGHAISIDPLQSVFAGQVNSVSQEAIMVLQVVLRFRPSVIFYPTTRDIFCRPSAQDACQISGGQEIWTGYHQSLRLGQRKPMLNMDVMARAFVKKGPLLNIIADILNLGVSQLSTRKWLKYSDVSKLNNELKGVSIQTTHLKSNQKRYRIRELTKDANNLMLNCSNNDEQLKITMADYFSKNYQPLKYPHFPCVQVNNKDIFLPIEVCEIMEDQPCQLKLSQKQRNEFTKFAVRSPKQRFDAIVKVLKDSKAIKDIHLKEFDMKISEEPIKLESRVIEAPKLRYTSGTTVKPVDGSWNMKERQYFRAAVVNAWVLISFADPRFCGFDALVNFAGLLCKIASEHGVSMRRPDTMYVVDNHQDMSVQGILTQARKLYNADLAVLVLPHRDKDIYEEIKRVTEASLGIVTQCVTDVSVSKKCTPSAVSNICQKLNAKMGGINSSLVPYEIPLIFSKPVIIMGSTSVLPTSHHADIGRLVSAVGSLDAYPCQYAATVRTQPFSSCKEKKKRNKLILDLKPMVLELLTAFYKKSRGRKPERIIFFRSGACENQFRNIRDYEVKCIREACSLLQPEYEPDVTFIALQKRHHVRFAPQDIASGCGKAGNIPPGTVVDTEVVHPLNFDFYLCGHLGSQGTSKPCHYTVLEDDSDLSADELQKLTYYLCHTYARCTKSISYPAPVRYAELAAARFHQHYNRKYEDSFFNDEVEDCKNFEIVDELKNTMYFI